MCLFKSHADIDVKMRASCKMYLRHRSTNRYEALEGVKWDHWAEIPSPNLGEAVKTWREEGGSNKNNITSKKASTLEVG